MVTDPLKLIEQQDPEISKILVKEIKRQEQHIELIASENYASPAVMAAANGHEVFLRVLKEAACDLRQTDVIMQLLMNDF